MLTVQSIQENLLTIKDNLSIISIVISLFALLATWGNFLNSKRAFGAANYPKIRAELKLLSRDTLPVYNIYNESDKLIANDIRIKISVVNWTDFRVFKGRWFTYTHERLARLKPLETFVPSGLSGDELTKWLNDRGLESSPPVSLKDQEVLSEISLQKSYSVRLSISYTSNMFGASEVCRIVEKCRLTSCFNAEAVDSRDQFYWRLRG